MQRTIFVKDAMLFFPPPPSCQKSEEIKGSTSEHCMWGGVYVLWGRGQTDEVVLDSSVCTCKTTKGANLSRLFTIVAEQLIKS